MRLFVCLHALSIFVLIKNLQAETNEERYHNYMNLLGDCAKENNITVEEYAYAAPKNNTNGIYDKSKCVDACMFRTLKILKPDGSFDMEKAMEHLLSGKPGVQRDIMRTNIERCNTKAENVCERSHMLMVCSLGFNYY